MSTATKLAIAVLVVLGILAFAAGVIYLSTPASKLPHILGQIPHAHYKRHKRGAAGIVAGIVLLVAAAGVWFAGLRARRPDAIEQ